jgi:hypothetical protein
MQQTLCSFIYFFLLDLVLIYHKSKEGKSALAQFAQSFLTTGQIETRLLEEITAEIYLFNYLVQGSFIKFAYLFW